MRESLRVPIAAMAAVLAATLTATAGESPASQPPIPDQPAESQTRLYTHPIREFSLPLPPGTQLTKRGEDPQISIRSPKGYMISVQSGAVRPAIPLASMSSLLEPKYLGEGKPWSERGEDRAIQVAGLPAHEVFYRGGSTRARVVVARGAKSDFVFIFFAPDRDFEKLDQEFAWVLKNFAPGPADLPKGAAAIKPVVESDAQQFSGEGYGYSIQYPGDWVLTKPSMVTTMFSGREGTPAYSAIVSIQNVRPQAATTGAEAVEMALAELRASLEMAAGQVRYPVDRPWRYQRGDLGLNGRHLVASYLHAGQPFQKLVIVVPRPGDAVAHVWTYTAPRDQYAEFGPIAQQMLQSWAISR